VSRGRRRAPETPPENVLAATCPGCGYSSWVLVGKVQRASRGFLMGWHYAAKLECKQCGRRISVQWGGEPGRRGREESPRPGR
jgi:hypothetical protein